MDRLEVVDTDCHRAGAMDRSLPIIALCCQDRGRGRVKSNLNTDDYGNLIDRINTEATLSDRDKKFE
jgi:hypothetical protein